MILQKRWREGTMVSDWIAAYEDYLDGLDEEAIMNVTEEANYAGRFPGLKIGDITKDNDNAGNW